MDDLLDEAPSSSSSSSHVGESSSSNLDRGTMTDEGCTDIGGAPRPIAARLYGNFNSLKIPQIRNLKEIARVLRRLQHLLQQVHLAHLMSLPLRIARKNH